MAMNDLKDSKIYIVMDKICKLYEEDGYRKTFMKNEFKEKDALYDTKRISVITFLVSSEMAMIAVFVSLGAYIHADPWIVYLFMTLAIILIGHYLRKF